MVHEKSQPLEFFVKPLEALDFSGPTLMRLWALGIENIGDLVVQDRQSLRKCLEEIHLREVEERLRSSGFSLRAKKPTSQKKKPRQFTATLSEERAKELHGEEKFLLYKQLKEGTLEEKHQALEEVVVQNVRLVWKIVWWYVSLLAARRDPAIDMEDLYQEGCIGLMIGAPRFDYMSGYRFSTFVTYWIKQAISRAIDDASAVPVHMAESIRRLRRVAAAWVAKNNREPTMEDLAEATLLSTEKIEKLVAAQQFFYHFSSLEEQVHGSDYKGSKDRMLLRDLVISPWPSLEEVVASQQLEKTVGRILEENLTERNRVCLELYFGVNGNRPHTLEEIGDRYGVSRERIRQITNKAMKKLRKPQILRLIREHLDLPTKVFWEDKVVSGSNGDEGRQAFNPVIPPAASAVIKKIIERPPLSPPVLSIINEVAKKTGCTSAEILENQWLDYRHCQKVVRARRQVAARLRNELGYTLEKIGRILRCRGDTVRNWLRGSIPKKESLASGTAPSSSKSRSKDLEVLDLPLNVITALRYNRGVTTVKELALLTRERLLMTTGFTEETVSRIEQALRRLGYRLSG